jgi:hypothetical protein
MNKKKIKVEQKLIKILKKNKVDYVHYCEPSHDFVISLNFLNFF